MVALKTQNFGGMCPAVNSRSLPPNAAVDVVNGRIHEGKITPFQQLSEQYAFTGTTNYKYAVRIPDPLNTANGGFTWLGGTSANFSFSRPAINEDEYQRYVYCNGDYLSPVLPRYNTLANLRNGVADYQLGVVQPTFLPIVSVSGGALPGANTATVYQTGLQAGRGYNVGDTITLAGGTYTTPMVLEVSQVNDAVDGGIVAVTIVSPGSYSITPSNPVQQASTSGGGAGAGFTCTFGSEGAEAVGLVSAGSGYAPGDTITVAGGTHTQAAVLSVGTISGTATTGPIATAFVSTPGEYTALPSNPVSQASTSGSGTGGTFNATWSGQQGLTAAVYYTSAVGGTNYQVNDTITIAGGTLTSAATPAVLTVSSVSAGGVVTGVYVSTPGAYTALPSNPVSQASTSGIGSGAEFVIVWDTDSLVGAVPAAAGSGYVIGDTLTLTGGTYTEVAKLTVASINSGGSIATVTVAAAGAYTVYPTSPVSVTGGTGTGATLNAVWGNQNPTETRAYVCTYVDIFGQESAPTDGATGTGETDGVWSISGFAFPTTNPGAPIVAINIYRTITTSATTAVYYFVAAVPVGGAQSGTIANPGSGYKVGDTIYLAGGTFTEQAELMVTGVSVTGGITTFEVISTGLYSVFPTNPAAQASTSGIGAGATFTMVWLDGESSYLDTTTDQDLSLEAVQLQTQGWLPPVAMEGFIAVANGFLCGWAGNQIYFSQPSAPWAWPVEYQTSVDAQIVGMGYLDGSIIVFTTSSPFQLTGTTPGTMTNVKVSTISPCTSRGSISQAIDGIDYATRNGIVNSSPYGFVNVSDKVISSEEWRQSYFSQIIAGARYEDTYIGLVGPGEGYVLALQGYEGGYFMNPQNVRIALSRFLLQQPVTNMFQDPFSSCIFMMAGNTVYLWDDPTSGTMICRWKSKEFAGSDPVNMAAYVCALDVPASGPQNSDDPEAYASLPSGGTDNVPYANQVAANEITSLIGYGMVGGPVIGAGVAYGTVPPGMTDPLSPVYPFWPGLLTPQANKGQSGAGPGGSGDPDWTVTPSLPYGVEAYLEVFANRFTVYGGAIESNVQTRLPSGFKSTLWQYSITTSVPVWSFAWGTSAKELKNAQ